MASSMTKHVAMFSYIFLYNTVVLDKTILLLIIEK